MITGTQVLLNMMKTGYSDGARINISSGAPFLEYPNGRLKSKRIHWNTFYALRNYSYLMQRDDKCDGVFVLHDDYLRDEGILKDE